MQWNAVRDYWQAIRSATSQLPDLRGTLVGLGSCASRKFPWASGRLNGSVEATSNVTS